TLLSPQIAPEASEYRQRVITPDRYLKGLLGDVRASSSLLEDPGQPEGELFAPSELEGNLRQAGYPKEPLGQVSTYVPGAGKKAKPYTAMLIARCVEPVLRNVTRTTYP